MKKKQNRNPGSNQALNPTLGILTSYQYATTPTRQNSEKFK